MLQANARSVNVKRVDLLTKLKENRDKHAADYAQAFQAYRIEVVKVLTETLAQAQANIAEFDDGLSVTELAPPNHLSDYDQVIAMMEMSIDETISLDSSSFAQYVLDQWHWKQEFAITTSKYIGNLGGALK